MYTLTELHSLCVSVNFCIRQSSPEKALESHIGQSGLLLKEKALHSLLLNTKIFILVNTSMFLQLKCSLILKICSNSFSFSLRVSQLTINLLIRFLVDVVPMSSPLTESRIDNVAQPEGRGMDSVSMSPKGTDREESFS